MSVLKKDDPESTVGEILTDRMDEYQQRAIAMATYPMRGEGDLRYCCLGLCGEAGELANKIKKIYRDHDGIMPPAMREDLKLELGDVLWYVANLAEELGTNLGSVATLNLEKLQARKAANTIKGSGDNR